jgi:hypothetical protein
MKKSDFSAGDGSWFNRNMLPIANLFARSPRLRISELRVSLNQFPDPVYEIQSIFDFP